MIVPILLLLALSIGSVVSQDKLLFVQVMFRHGARAPSERLTNQSFYQYFPRGLGELTDRGFENSHLLGKFLRKRYVETGFLNPLMKPKDMYWRSVNKNRCLSTAATVGAAMFEEPGAHIHVPVYTEEHGETLLSYDQNNCPRELELIRQICPNFSGNFNPWPMYEAFVADCLGYTHPVFNNYSFHTLEAHINEYKNGLPLPGLLANNINDIMKIYVNVTQWITGTGHHHRPDMMRVKFGHITFELLDNLLYFYKNYNSTKPKRIPRFMAYSTQDWILMGILDSFGVLNVTVGLEKYPEYNSMIIMELWDRQGQPYVKMLYKSEEKTSENHPLTDVSNKVRFCPANEPMCPFQNFKTCCSNYKVDTSKNSCVSASSGGVGRRKRRLAGPE